MGLRSRDGNHAGVQRSEKRGGEHQPRRVDQKDTITCGAMILKEAADFPCLIVQIGIGEAAFFALSVGEEGVSVSIRLVDGSPAEKIDNRSVFQAVHCWVTSFSVV